MSKTGFYSSLVVVLIICSITILAFTAKSDEPIKQGEDLPEIVNMTEALKVESITREIAHPEMGGVRIVMSLKNISSNVITAYAIQGMDGAVAIKDFTIGLGGIGAGQTEKIELSDYSITDPTSSLKNKKVVIKLAIFSDGSSEGDFEEHKKISDNRRGEKLQLLQINQVLKKYLQFTDNANLSATNDRLKWLNNITEEINLLSDYSESNRSNKVSEGMRSAKERAIYLLSNLKDAEDSQLTTLSKRVDKLRSIPVISESINSQEGISKIINFNQSLIDRLQQSRN